MLSPALERADFEVLDLFGPLEMFGNLPDRIEVVTVAEEPGPVRSAQGPRVHADHGLADCPPLDPLDLVRMIATARITMPASFVRLSAGRTEMSEETQALCFLAGANSIFTGERLLTTPNPGQDHDRALLGRLGLSPL